MSNLRGDAHIQYNDVMYKGHPIYTDHPSKQCKRVMQFLGSVIATNLSSTVNDLLNRKIKF